MSGFTKLFSSIVSSTVWGEDLATRVVWITMLALADRDGIVEASVPGLAHMARVTVEQTEAALAKFLQPDRHSRSPEHEGRRIEVVDGGWRLLNYDKYRGKLSAEDIREKNRLRQQRSRERRRNHTQEPSDAERDASVTSSDNRPLLRKSRHSRSRSRCKNHRNTGAGDAEPLGDVQACVETRDAIAMLNVFESVGVAAFDITVTDVKHEKINFRRKRGIKMLRCKVGAMLQQTRDDEHNLIIRPRPGTFSLVQLDDLNSEKLQKVIPFSFLAIRTSPDNHQAWVAVKDAGPDVPGILREGVGADPTASGATRIAGSVNYKAEYAPYFPVVTVVHLSTGKFVTIAELEGSGLVAAPEEPARVVQSARAARGTPKKWPDYEMCVKGAPPVHGSGRPDISKADFTWCLTAIDWGWGVEETADRLTQQSRKAKGNGAAYALRTAQNAAARVAKRNVGRD